MNDKEVKRAEEARTITLSITLGIVIMPILSALLFWGSVGLMFLGNTVIAFPVVALIGVLVGMLAFIHWKRWPRALKIGHTIHFGIILSISIFFIYVVMHGRA